LLLRAVEHLTLLAEQSVKNLAKTLEMILEWRSVVQLAKNSPKAKAPWRLWMKG
jgi:hypothetical protein